MKTVAFRLVEGILVVVHGWSAPSDEDWNEHLQWLDAHATEVRGVLVVTEGPRPNVQMREQMRSRWTSNHPPPIAIVTSSRLARNTAGLLTWFFRDRMRVFAPRELDEALAFLQVDASQAEGVKAAIDLLRIDVGAPPMSKANS